MAAKKPTTIDGYIAAAPEPARPHLTALRQILRDAAPEAEEAIKWGNAAFSLNRILYVFAAYKNHLNFYPTPAVIKAFEKELRPFRTGDASVQLPYRDPLPADLIRNMADYRVRDLFENDAKWM